MIRRFFSRKSKKTTQLEETVEPLRQEELTRERDDSTVCVEDYDDLSFIVDYIGSDYVTEAQSVPLLMETLKRIKKQHSKTIRVDLELKSGIFKVSDIEQGALLITAPLYAIALCAQDQLRGFETTFALNITRRRIHMCHVFQAGSTLEAAAIVRSIALSFRSVAKDLTAKRYESTLVERVRSDSEGSTSRYRVRTESDSNREFDVIARRHLSRVGTLPTLQSEENLDKNTGENDDQVVSVMVHQAAGSSNDTASEQIVSLNDNTNERIVNIEDDQIENNLFSEHEEPHDKLYEANISDLFPKAIQAIESHDKGSLIKCFEDGLPIDATDSNHLSLLHYSVLKNKVDIAEFLLERGADVNKEGQKDQTPLHCAAAQGNRATTKLLLAHGANVRAKDCQFRTPLHLCAGCLQSLEVSYVLVEHGARIEDNDIEGVRPVDLHLELREMQNRLIQSATEAFAAADLSRSRSNSGNSSHSGSFKSSTKSPIISRRGHNRLFRTSSLRLKASPSLHSIPDVGDTDTDSQFSLPRDILKTDVSSDASSGVVPVVSSGTTNAFKQSPLKNAILSNRVDDVLSDSSSNPSKVSDQSYYMLSDQILSDSTESAREELRTDSEIDSHKESFFSDEYVYPSESDDENLKHMRELIDNKTLHPNRINTPTSMTRLFKKDPATDALHLLVTLSANVECQSTILANLCLPKASSQLVSLAHSITSTNINLQQISTLLHNLFSVGGPTGRQKCISTGLLKTVVDLLDATEPVQGTCLSILNDLLQTENERDYSGTISGIPIEPLLTIIKSIDSNASSEIEPVSGKTKLRLAKSIDSGYPASPFMERSGSIKKRREEKDPDNIALKSYSWGKSSKTYTKGEHLLSGAIEGVGRGRSESFGSSSDAARDSSPLSAGRGSSRNSDSDSKELSSIPAISRARRHSRGSNSSVEGQAFVKTPNTSVVARHVAMKMLAASSRNAKLQEQLAKPRILKLLFDCLDDPDVEIVLQATATLANIAMNIDTHMQLQAENIEEGLFKLLKHTNPRIQYQAARGLVYLGNEVNGVYIFNYLPDEDSSPTVIYVEEEGRTFIRGTTVENLVLTLTKDIHLLWGGASIVPPSPNDKKTSMRCIAAKLRAKTTPTEGQIINFVLSTFQTFVHPIIFMRLLLHRFREPDVYKIFLECEDGSGEPCMEHYAPLPILHARLLRIWIAWLENYPMNFVTYPTLSTELSSLISPMRAIDGPYAPCANRLESLMLKAVDGSDHGSLYRCESDSHHNVLYDQCFKAIKDGRLPCSDDDFFYLAGLQLYIEDLCLYGHDFTERLHLAECLDNINATRIKNSIGSTVTSSKQQSKKIRTNYESFFTKQPTERNAKHNYVDCCQGMDGYGCTFFKVKQRIPSARSRKKIYIGRFLGISSKRIVVLDERSKVCVEKFNSKDLRRWKPMEDSLTLKMLFKAKTSEKTLEFQLENRVGFKELSNHILTCTMEINFQGYHNIDTNPWSRLAEQCGTWGNMALQLHVDKTKTENDGTLSAQTVIRDRSTTTTEFPVAGCSHTSTDTATSIPRNYSHSAPVKQDSSWNTSEVAAGIFFNLKGILRSRVDTILSPSPSESSTPPKELMLGENFVPLSPQSSVIEARRNSKTRGLSPFLSPLLEKTPMLEDSNNEKSSGDHSPTEFARHTSGGKILTCHCPPDADLPNLNLREFSAFELLDHPKELARQLTLIDHELFCAITSLDVLLKISLGLIRKHQDRGEMQLTVERIAERFNKMSNWIVYCIVSERNIHRRAKMFMNFIETAKQCLELRNYNAVMAIVVASLGSTHVRRLAATKELVPADYLSCLSKMESLMDSKSNHKKYREALRTSPTPAVPYFGIYLKDLTFISDGNPDLLKGGVINLSKRRQVYIVLEKMHRFQRKRYNFQEVSEIKDYLISKPSVTADQLHQMSKEHEPTITTPLGLSTPPVTQHSLLDRRPSLPTNLFRHNSGNRTTSKKVGEK